MTTNRSTRRRLAAGSALVVAAMLTTAACGGGGKDDGDAAPGFNAATKGIASQSTKKGGTLKFVGSQDFDSLDPARMYYGFAWDFSRFYTRQLVSYATKPGVKSTSLVPDLATDMAKITDDGKTYTYTLRDGLTFEDGTPITSKDVKYGIERTWATDVISGGPGYLKQVLDPKGEYKGPYKDKSKDKLGLKSIETPDDKTIIFKLPKPNGDFEQILALPTSTPVPQAKDTGAKYALKPVSSGPYKIQSYTLGKGGTLVRNENWKKESDPIRPALPDKITVTINTNPDDVDKRLIKGDYDLDLNATGMTPSGRADALKKHRDNLDNGLTNFIRYAVFPETVKPMDNIHCRKAVIYAADKKSLQTARGGPLAGGEIAENMLPKSIKGSDEYDPYGVLKNPGANIAKAKEELKACGKPNGFKTTISVRNNKPQEVATAEALQNALGKVGIDAEVDQIDGAQSQSITGSPKVVKSKGYGVIISGWGPDFPTGQGFSQPLVDGRFIVPTGNYNNSETDDPKINKLFDDAIAETDPDKAGEIYKEINHMVSDRAIYLPFVFEKTITWRSSRLTNVYTADSYSGRYDYVSLGVVK
ncbi:ABC transporter substrate-binding protein [Streptomyces sp. KR80]|uniref:ABC transporter substrate-binding protein n=1 Tax=Streptomyces sp. KR80 TaxID=3457426 RepID=UPI003FD52371